MCALRVVVSPPRELGGFANRSGQAAHGSRRVSVWIVLFFAISKLFFAAFFGFIDSFDYFVAVGRFRTVHVIFWTQGFEDFLHLVAVFSPVEIHLMQNKPKLETWIRAADVDAVSFAKSHRLIVVRMFVPVEHCPDLVVFLERIFFPAAAPVESQSSGVLNGFFRNGVGNAHGGDNFQED